jgi:hypothetical protein
MGGGAVRCLNPFYDAVKIFCDKNGKVTRVPYVEHVPPDVTAQIFWLKNRKPSEWRDVQNIEHAIGKYIISDKPMTEEEWTRERADVIDVTPDDEKKRDY